MSDFFSLCTITCGINHRKPDGKDLTKEDVIQEMTYAIENLFGHFEESAHEELQLTQTHSVEETT
tara:strand:+ start:399 stop:593 length:195 start_codon:yes stop_codon:yes gene_type:complete